MNKETFFKILIILTLFISIVNLSLIVKIREATILDTQPKQIIQQEKCIADPIENPTATEILQKGTVKKQKDDRDLGSPYMYEFYFDEPFLLKYGSIGFPVLVDSMEIYGFSTDMYKIDDFVGKHVVMYGNLDWGYAESRVIVPVSMKVLK